MANPGQEASDLSTLLEVEKAQSWNISCTLHFFSIINPSSRSSGLEMKQSITNGRKLRAKSLTHLTDFHCPKTIKAMEQQKWKRIGEEFKTTSHGLHGKDQIASNVTMIHEQQVGPGSRLKNIKTKTLHFQVGSGLVTRNCYTLKCQKPVDVLKVTHQ
jgi:hypothetical protein